MVLTEDEEDMMMPDKEDVFKGVEDNKISCLEKLYTSKEFPLCILRPLIRKVWKLDKLRIVKIRSNAI